MKSNRKNIIVKVTKTDIKREIFFLNVGEYNFIGWMETSMTKLQL